MNKIHAAKAGTKCPECNADLTGQDVEKHSRSHWPDRMPNDPAYAEPRKRQKALLALEDADLSKSLEDN